MARSVSQPVKQYANLHEKRTDDIALNQTLR